MVVELRSMAILLRFSLLDQLHFKFILVHGLLDHVLMKFVGICTG